MATTFYSRLDLKTTVEPMFGESRERLNAFTTDGGYTLSRDGDVVTMRHKSVETVYELPWADVRRAVVLVEPVTKAESPQAKAAGK